MFNTTHILYMVVSLLISVGTILILKKNIKTDKGHNAVIRTFAVLTVLIHYSSLWVDFFSTGEAVVQDSMLLPIYACNVCMWLLAICSFIKKRDTILYKLLSEFCLLGGVVCSVIGILLNENFGANPTLTDYEVLKGLLSHSTMLIGSLYLGVCGFAKIRVSNIISVVSGLVLFIIDGAIINALHAIFGLDSCNSMYLERAPFPDMPWLTTFTIGVMAVTATFIITSLYELLFLPRDERWYVKLGKIIERRKGKKENK